MIATSSACELNRGYTARVSESLTPGDSIDLLRDGAEVFPSWLEAIASARDEILLEMYWFASDRVGRRFAELLAKKASEGVDVFVLYDAIGSIGTDVSMFTPIIEAGGVVMEFHPIAPWRTRFRLDKITLRDHRKILVIDATTAFTGGVNICDQESPRDEGGGGWRDDGVRISGPSVLELRALFYDNWLRIGGPSPRRGAAAVRRARKQMVAAALAQAGRARPLGESWGKRILNRISFTGTADIVRQPTGLRPPPIQVLGHAAWSARRTIRNMYVAHIRSASERILIENSYFVPDNTVRRALERAARRGIEVRVIVPAHSDVPSVQYASRALYTRLMRAGVRIHEWTESMLHSKTAVIDRWATVGSYNLDYRSLRYNLEVNVASDSRDFVASVEQGLRLDIERCVEVDPVAWSRRPMLQKILEWGWYLLRKLM